MPENGAAVKRGGAYPAPAPVPVAGVARRTTSPLAPVFDCFRFMELVELAEIGRCRASVSPPQTHQNGLLSSIGMAVAVFLGVRLVFYLWLATRGLCPL